VIIACAIGLGRALEVTGAASSVGDLLVYSGDLLGMHGMLAVVFLLGIALNSAITNVAAAAILFPIVLAAAAAAGYDPRPFVMMVAIAASCSFLTPTAYQTNLMVYGPGGYRFADFARLGAPLQILMCIIATVLVPIAWPP